MIIIKFRCKKNKKTSQNNKIMRDLMKFYKINKIVVQLIIIILN